jgi:hypothetical protein
MSATAAAVAEITAQLAKKGTFMQGVQKLTQHVGEAYAGCSEADRTLIFTASKRCFTLLCSRYTAVGFWRVGKELFAAVLAAFASEPARSKPAQEWFERAKEEVGKGDDESKGTTEPQPANRPAPAAAPSASQADAMGVRASEELRAVLQQHVREVDVEQLLALIELQAGSDLDHAAGGERVLLDSRHLTGSADV